MTAHQPPSRADASVPQAARCLHCSWFGADSDAQGHERANRLHVVVLGRQSEQSAHGSVSTYDEYLQTYRPDEWERQRRERLTPEQVAYEDTRDAIRAAAASICRHCGALPEADGDHSCPCPHSDQNCPDHPVVTPSQDAPSAANAMAEGQSLPTAQEEPK